MRSAGIILPLDMRSAGTILPLDMRSSGRRHWTYWRYVHPLILRLGMSRGGGAD